MTKREKLQALVDLLTQCVVAEPSPRPVVFHSDEGTCLVAESVLTGLGVECITGDDPPNGFALGLGNRSTGFSWD